MDNAFCRDLNSTKGCLCLREMCSIGFPFLLCVTIVLTLLNSMLLFHSTSYGEESEEPSWAKALAEATSYALGDHVVRNEALRLYEDVLSLGPPRSVELHVRLTMAARMTILFDPDLGEEERWAEALPLYEALVEDFADWPTHHDVMVAKIHLGDLYCELQGDEGASKAEELYWSAIDVAEENIVFDDPDFTHLNVESIARASAPVGRRLAEDGSLMVAPTEEMNAKHRQGLLALRKGWTEALRRSAVRALAFKKYDPELPDISIARLTALKKQRIDDALFQNALDSLIEDLATSSAARQDDSWTRPLLDAITEEESKPEATEE